PSVPPRARKKLDSIDRLPSVGLPPAHLGGAFTLAPIPPIPSQVPSIPPPPALPHSLMPTAISRPPPPPFATPRVLRTPAAAVVAGIVLGACATLTTLALSKR